MQRPTSISIIGWLLVVPGALGLVSVLANPFIIARSPQAAAFAARSPSPPALTEAVGLVGGAVNAAAGVMLLRRIAAGRSLYVAWGALTLLFSF